MSRASGSTLVALVAVMIAAVSAPAAIEAPLRIPGDDLPGAVSKLGDLNGLTAFAISDDGATAAGAFAAEKQGRSVLRVSRGAGTGGSPAEIAIRGRARALRFSRDGVELFVVAARESKRDNAEAFLLRITVATRELSREIVLPRGATDVDTLDAGTLIVTGPNELRTFLVPSLASGPLYRLSGSNRAVAAVPGTRRLLVAGEDSIVLVDLDDPQSRDGLPARERLTVTTPVVSLAVAPDGSEALARHEDGQVERFTVEPLGGAVTVGPAVAIAWPGRRADAPPPAPRAQSLPNVPTETAAQVDPDRGPQPEPPSAPSGSTVPMQPEPPAVPPETAPPSQREPVQAEPAEPEQPSPAPVQAETASPPQPLPAQPPPAPPPSQPAPAPPVESPPPQAPPVPLPDTVPAPPAEAPVPESETTPSPGEPVPPTPPDNAPQSEAAPADLVVLRGSVTGAAAASVVAVVILGPDNLLREAARAKPSADGSWSVTGLTPGTYRIQPDAGSGRAVEAVPAFRTVRIEHNGTTQVAPIEARRVL